jgi:hypothetical protein
MPKFRALLFLAFSFVGIATSIGWLIIPPGHLALRAVATVLMLTCGLAIYFLGGKQPHA